MSTASRAGLSRTRAALLGMGLAALVGGAGVAVGAAPASAATARVDMQRACNDQYGAGFGYLARPLNARDAFSWRCTKPWDTRLGIDVNRACATQYGSGWSAGLRSRTDAYSWYCKN